MVVSVWAELREGLLLLLADLQQRCYTADASAAASPLSNPSHPSDPTPYSHHAMRLLFTHSFAPLVTPGQIKEAVIG